MTSSKKADGAALRDLADLIDVVDSVERAKFYVKNTPDNDHITLKDLDAAQQRLTAAKTALPTGDTQPPEVVTAGNDATAAGSRLTAERSAVTKTREDLRNAVSGVFPFAKGLLDLSRPKLAILVNLDGATLAPALRTVLPQQLPTYRAVEQLSREFKETWDVLSVKLKPMVIDSETKIQQIDTTQAAVRADLLTIYRKLVRNIQDEPSTPAVENDAWLVRLAKGGIAATDLVSTLRNNVREDPVRYSSEGVQKLRDTSPWLDDLRTTQLEWIATEVQLASSTDLDFQSVFADDAATRLETSVRMIKAALSDLQDALAGDLSKFEADQISLFYFTDIPRLMQMLNSESHEVGGIRTATEEAASRRRELTNADLDLADAQSAVNAAQQRVVVLREELRQANAASDAASKLFKRTSVALRGAQRDKDANDKRFTDGQCDPPPTDPEKRAKCDSLAVERDRASARLAEADQRNKDAEEDKKRTTERSEGLRDEQNGLPSKIAEAESRLSDAQAAVNRQRRSALLAAQAESEAFVKARDNRPFWVAPVNATSTDPVKHVFLWAFNDNKTVFMRGPREDMNYVKCIIAKIDQPAPQARMTLWTLELSSDSSVGGAKKTNESLEIIERHLSNSRALTAATLSVLRDAINERVNLVAEKALHDACPAGFYECPEKDLLNKQDNLRLARLKFYHPEVLRRLGFEPDHLFESAKTDPMLARLIVPDPAGTTTLGEALMVLSLGRLEYRQDVISVFLSRLSLQLPQLGLKDLPEALQRLNEKRKSLDITWFPSLRRAINLDGFQRPDPKSKLLLTSQQLEILRNLLPGTPEYKAKVVKDVSRARSREHQLSIAQGAGLTEGQAKAVGFNSTDTLGDIVPQDYREDLTSSQLEILHSMQKVSQENVLKYMKVFIRQYVERETEFLDRTNAEERVNIDIKSLCSTDKANIQTDTRNKALQSEICITTALLRRVTSQGVGLSWEEMQEYIKLQRRKARATTAAGTTEMARFRKLL